MTLDVKSLRSRFESVADLLDDYCCLVCGDYANGDCFTCPVRRAQLEAQSGKLYVSAITSRLQAKVLEEVPDDIKSNSSGS